MSTAAVTPGPVGTPRPGTTSPPGGSRRSDERAAYERKVERLSALSEGGPYDAFEDVPWDQSGFELDPTDPRLQLFTFDPLARTPWYQQLDDVGKARVGLRRMGANLRVGWEFENFLQQGLLIRALRMRNDDVAFRYSHHEIAEESHHSMMFHEFVRRYAPEVGGMPRPLKALTTPAVQLSARRFPALFFFLVLSGEVPIDHVQRQVTRQEDVHPLVRRIMEIHVEEEARHVGFAQLELRRTVPRLPSARRQALARLVPETLAITARLMLYPSPWQIRYDRVPTDQLRAAFRHPQTRQLLVDATARIRRLCHELDLMTPAGVAAWKRGGMWAEPTRTVA